MANPTPYEIEYSFSGFQASNPSTPLPASALDNELENIALTLSEAVAALADVRASDGGLKNGIVTAANLSSDLLVGLPEPEAWITLRAYAPPDTVFNGALLYICKIVHTSSVFATDLAAGRWALLADFTPTALVEAEDVEYDPSDSELDAENVQDAIDEVVERVVAVEGSQVARADLASDVTIGLLPIGMIAPFAGSAAPAGWLLCGGQAVSRSLYPDLFIAVSTVYGAGDGSTTFNVPDLQGRVIAGKDDMGGASANRLTGLTGGVDGDTLGAAGGSQSHVLTSAQLAAHSHSFSATSAAGGQHGHILRTSTTTSSGADGTGGVMLDSSASGNQAAFTGTPNDTLGQQLGGSGTHTHVVSGTTGSGGSGAAHNNVQPTMILNYIIFAGVVV